MASRDSTRTATRRAGSTIVVTLLVASAGVVGVVTYQSMTATQTSNASPSWSAPIPSASSSSPAGSPSVTRPRPSVSPPSRGEAAGAVPDDTTVFDDLPAVANLDPDLLRAVRQAATDAADDGVEIFVNSGWRSPAYQERLLREAVDEYGSEEEAARWVATPDTSPHVSGDAIDLGRSDATKWLSKHGDEYGLCQIFRNEPWHYELRPEAVDEGCPPMYDDPTEDPRMRK
jgi:hypothetical protein